MKLVETTDLSPLLHFFHMSIPGNRLRQGRYLSETFIIQAILQNQDSDTREGYLKGDRGEKQRYGNTEQFSTTMCLKYDATKFISTDAW